MSLENRRLSQQYVSGKTILHLDTSRRSFFSQKFIRQSHSKAVELSPDQGNEVLAVERQAMAAVMKDPGFLAEAKRLRLPIDSLPGEIVEAKIKAALQQPPETIAALKRAAGG